MFSDIRLKLEDPVDSSALRATCSLTLGGLIRLHNVRVVHGKTGLFVAPPSQRSADRMTRHNHWDILNKDDAQELQRYVLAAYAKVNGRP